MPFLKKKSWETEKIEDNEETSPEVKEKSWMKKEGELVVDVYETYNHVVIQAPVAGVKREDLEIVTEKDTVIIKGRRECPEREDIKEFYNQECFFGDFRREIIIPEETDPSNIEASIDNGILTILIPKTEKKERRKIDF